MSFNIITGAFLIWLGVAGLSCTDNPEKIKHDQYFAEGSQLYSQHCSNCHQSDGSGVANLYPPLAGADYLKNTDNLACIIRYGLQGEIQVNGKSYHQPMPANPALKSIEIAEIITFITNEWGGSQQMTTIKQVEQALKTCKE